MGCTVSLVVIVNLKASKNDAKLYIGTGYFFCIAVTFILPQSA